MSAHVPDNVPTSWHLSLGPTREQSAYARGRAAGLRAALTELRVMAEMAARDSEALTAASAYPDADTAAGEARGRVLALCDAVAALSAMAGK